MEIAPGADDGAGSVHIHRDEKPQRRKKPPKIFYATRTHSQIAQVREHADWPNQAGIEAT